MKKLALTIFAAVGLMSLTFGQYVDQALIFSQQNYGSTARSKAMGNAMGAIGGDFSTLSINPAGIGIYIRSELSTTLDVLGVTSTKATYQGESADARNNNFNFRNLGYVFANPTQNGGSGLVSFNFGVGFNKLNNFNQTITVSKTGSPHSRMDQFAQMSKGIQDTTFYDEYNPYQNINIPWESKLAYENYLIDVANPNEKGHGDTYQSILYQDELVNQNYTVNKEGFLNEYVFSFGANFNHKLYLGATIGLQDLYYNESSTYTENGNSNQVSFGSFSYTNSATTRGLGYNLKLGVIYKPIPELRLGAAIHTPTFFDFKETYSSLLSSNLKNVSANSDGVHQAESPLGNNDYKMDTPTRMIGSIAYQFGKIGMISIDYENVNYSNVQYLNRNGNDFTLDNTTIKTKYKNTGNLRIGGEFKPTNAVSLRAGYELFGNPYKSSLPDPNDPTKNIVQPNSNFSYNTINMGIGYRIDNVLIDLSYSLGRKTDYNYIYTSNDPVKYERNKNEIVLTLSIKL